MIAGGVDELGRIADLIGRFAHCPEVELVIEAIQGEDPAPYTELLGAICLSKDGGPLFIGMNSMRQLSVTGSPATLERFGERFRFPADARNGDHHHLEPHFADADLARGSMSAITEVLDD